MNIGYLIYQAERQQSAAERRAEDVRRGELARAITQLVRRGPSRAADARGHRVAPDAARGCRDSAPELAGC
jgi:hypothetical protein